MKNSATILRNLCAYSGNENLPRLRGVVTAATPIVSTIIEKLLPPVVEIQNYNLFLKERTYEKKIGTAEDLMKPTKSQDRYCRSKL